MPLREGYLIFYSLHLKKRKTNRMKVKFINIAYRKASMPINSHFKYTSYEIHTRISHNFDMEKMSWK